MKKRTGIIIAIIVILAVIVGACIYGYMSGRNETENTPSETVEGSAQTGQTQEEQSDEPEGGESVQPEQANPSGGESVVVYVPDEQGETLTPVGADAADDSDQALVDALICGGLAARGRGGAVLVDRGRRAHAGYERGVRQRGALVGHDGREQC